MPRLPVSSSSSADVADHVPLDGGFLMCPRLANMTHNLDNAQTALCFHGSGLHMLLELRLVDQWKLLGSGEEGGLASERITLQFN